MAKPDNRAALHLLRSPRCVARPATSAVRPVVSVTSLSTIIEPLHDHQGRPSAAGWLRAARFARRARRPNTTAAQACSAQLTAAPQQWQVRRPPAGDSGPIQAGVNSKPPRVRRNRRHGRRYAARLAACPPRPTTHPGNQAQQTCARQERPVSAPSQARRSACPASPEEGPRTHSPRTPTNPRGPSPAARRPPLGT